jgi:hypothetical protein
MEQNLLAHIEENRIDPTTLDQFCNSVTIGPVKINYCIDLTVPQITFEIYLAGVRIGGGTINTSNPTVTLGGSVDGFKAELTLTADFPGKKVTYKLTVCVPFFGCTTYEGTLFSW